MNDFDESNFLKRQYKMDIIWHGLIHERQRFETNNFGDLNMTAMAQFVARENPLMAVWNLWIDNRWLMDYAACILMESEVQPAFSSFFALHGNLEKTQETNWEDLYFFHDPLHPHTWVVQNTWIFCETNPYPESLPVPGPTTLGSGNCLSGRVDLGQVMFKGLKIVRWWGWY